MFTLQNNLSKLSLAIIFLSSLVLIYFAVWRVCAPGEVTVVHGDGRDFYSYLPDIFINKNLGHQDVSNPWILQTPTGTINIHTAGVAFLLLPFFALGYVWALMGNYDLTGLSEPFQKMVSIGALFYLMVGLYFIRKLLAVMNFRDSVIAIVLLLIFFGTNLLNYGLNEPSMSHVYSFAAIAAFLYVTFKTFTTIKARYLYFAALLYGLIILIRPVNAIVILMLPFLAGSFSELTQKLKQLFNAKRLAVSILLFGSVVFIQSALWLVQNGNFMQWTQKHDGFYFFDPHPILMLFGFDGGFFIYTPLCFFLLMGLIPLFKQDRSRFIALTFFIVFWFYLFSSHWGYTYFDGLSIRPMVDYYSVFAILTALLISSISGVKRFVLAGILALTVFLNLIYNYQYKTGIIQAAAMNFEKFKYVFLETAPGYRGVLGGCMDLVPYSKDHPKASYNVTKTFDDQQGSYFNYSGNEYGVEYRIDKIGFKSNKLFFKVNLKRKESEINSSSKALLAISVEDPVKGTKFFQAFRFNDVPSENCCEWKECVYHINTPQQVSPDDKLIVFIWNKEKQNFLVDDFKVEVYNYNVEI